MVHRLLISILAAGCGASSFAAAPVLDDPAPVDAGGKPTHVAPKVLVGKTLIYPITASDTDGDVLRYQVTSSNPNVLVRVHTGQPHLKFAISHAGDGTAADPAFSGEAEFAFLSDLTPITCNFIGGMAQGHFYDGKIFHRLADLDPNEGPNGSFIFQGGDPQGTGSGGPGFVFENEFQAPLIFAGRGQLAMANSGSNSATYKGSNGSQFFITNGSPRFLDFNHNIFAQLVRGWDLLPQLAAVPRSAQDRPLVNVTLDTARVVPNFTDAVLEISATSTGTATITVSVNDGVSPVVARTFTVTAVKDTKNTAPFLVPVPSKVVEKNVILDIPLQGVDLESDFLFYGNSVLSGAANGSGSGNPARVVGTGGAVNFGVTVTPYDMTYRGTIDGAAALPDDKVPVALGVGDRAIQAQAVSFEAAPGVGLTSQIVATYADADPRGVTADFTTKINWGDGTPINNGVLTRDTTQPGLTRYVVAGAHTYANPGTYPVVVDFTGNKGTRATTRGTAVVSAGAVKALGTNFKVNGATATSRVVAAFSDTAPGRPADYAATISWGDGVVSNGKVRLTDSGIFQVLGTHTFVDPENFLVSVRLRKTGADPANDAFAWSLAKVSGFTGPEHRPPFLVPHLIGQLTQVQVPNSSPAQFKPVRVVTGSGSSLQATATCELIIVNAGKKSSTEGKLRFYLSADKTLNLAAQTLPDPANPGQTYVNPADKPVLIGTVTESPIQALTPGQGVRFVFDQADTGDSRLFFPQGENGSAFNLLAHFEYSDPIADNLPIGREVVFGPFNGFVVTPTFFNVREADPTIGTKTFSVKMDRQPGANVTVAVAVSDPTQVDVTPLTLTFTPADFASPHIVTVTAKDDGAADGDKDVRITLQPAVSTDKQWNRIDPDDVIVTVKDKAPTP